MKKGTIRAVISTLIGSGVHIHIFMFFRQISFQIDKFELDLKRNSVDTT